MGTAAAEHIKAAHQDFWVELVAHATRCLEAARICWDRRNSIRPDLRPTLHENERFKNRANIHIPCPLDCGVTLHDALTTDQIKDWYKLQVSDEAVDHCVTRLAEHLMRHRRSQVAPAHLATERTPQWTTHNSPSSSPRIRSSRFDGKGLPEAPSMKTWSDSSGRNTC